MPDDLLTLLRAAQDAGRAVFRAEDKYEALLCDLYDALDYADIDRLGLAPVFSDGATLATALHVLERAIRTLSRP